MAAKKPQINKIKTTIESTRIYLRSEKKWGKSTLFRDIVLEKYGDPSKGYLMGVGYETGYDLLDELNAGQIENFQDFLDTIDWLVTQKGKEHDIRMVAVDVVDELIPLAEEYTISLYKKESQKPCKSILEAYGGFNRGCIRAGLEIKKAFDRLHKAGIGIFAIAHTKLKTVKQKGAVNEEDGYDLLTSTLSATYESVFADIFDIVLTGIVDRKVEEGKLVSSSRYLVFRGDCTVDAGGRLAAGTVPDRISFDKPNMAKDFIETIEEAMRKSKINPVSKEEFKKLQEEENKENETKAEIVAKQIESEAKTSQENLIDIDRNKEIYAQIESHWKDVSKDIKEKVKKLMEDAEVEKISDVENNKTTFMESVLNLIK